MMFRMNSARAPLPLALLLCCTFVGSSAVAQVLSAPGSTSATESTGNKLTEIIVTARKVGEDIQSIPESITAIDAGTLAAAHLTTLDGLNSLITNLNITQRADNTPDVVLRGVGSFGVVQGVGFYVNDVQQFEGQSVRPTDIERIEVLKGPQGTLFGGSNVGGAIKYVTKAPSDTLTGEGSIEYGRFKQQTVDAAISGPIAERLLARLSVFNDRSDGWLPDPTLGKTLPDSNETGGRLTLEYVGDQTKIIFYLSGNHIGSENMNLYYTPGTNGECVGQQCDHTYERVYNGGVDGTTPSYRRNLYSPTLAITHDFESFTFNSLTSYFHSSIESIANLDKGAGADIPGLGTQFVNYIQDFKKNVLSQEFRLSSSGSSSFRWLAGVFVQRIKSDALQIQTLGFAPTRGSPVGVVPVFPGIGGDALGLPPGLVAGNLPVSDVEYEHINRDYAIFGNASYDWNNLTLEAGLRLSSFNNTLQDTTAPASIAPPAPPTPLCGPCFGRAKRNAVVLPTASISYHFTKDVMGYVTVARGDEEGDLSDNPPGNPYNLGTLFGPQLNQVQPFKTELALSYEAGLKTSLFDRRLNLNAAAFYIDYTNRLFEVGKFSGGGIFTYTTNVGKSRNYGFEVDATARLPADFTVTAGLGVVQAIFGNAPFTDGLSNTINAQGSMAANTPDYQATLAVDWRHALSDDLVLGARVDSRFVGRAYWDQAGCSTGTGTNPDGTPQTPNPACPYNGARFFQRAYHLVNFGTSLDVGKHWSIGAHLLNAFDVKYNNFYADQSEIGSPYNVAGINRPRQWLVNLNARF